MNGVRPTVVGFNQVIVQERFIVMQVAIRMARLHARHGVSNF